MKNKYQLTRFILPVLLWIVTLNLYSQSVAALYSSGQKALEQGDAQKAMSIFDEVLKLRPYYYDAYAGRAQAWMIMKKPAEALNDASKAIEMKTDHAEALLIRSQILLSQGKQRQALQDLDKATSAQIIFPQAWIEKAKLLDQMGRSRDALICLKELEDRKGTQTPYQAFFLRSQLYENLGMIQEALEDMTRVLSLTSPSDSLYWKRARLYLAHQDTAASINDLGNVLHLNSSHVEARKLRAELYAKKGSFKSAHADLNHLIDAMKIRNNTDLYLSRATAVRNLLQYDDAIQDLSRAMVYDRDNPLILLERAEIYGLQGKETAALADFRRLMRMDVKDYRPWLGRAKYYFSHARYDLAMQDLNESIKIQASGEAYYLRGACYDLNGDRKKACEDLKKAAASGFEAAASKISSYCN